MPTTLDRRPIFDVVRKLLGRPFRQSEVDALDCAFDGRQDYFPDMHTRPTTPVSSKLIGPDGISLIKRFEGCAKRREDGLFEAYPDPGTGDDPWTIGWGATGIDHFYGGAITRGTVWTKAQCDTRLESDLVRYAVEVSDAIGEAPTTPSQFDALVSFHYNTGAIKTATLTRLHIKGDYPGAEQQFSRWRFAGGRILQGLVRRREAEAELYGS